MLASLARALCAACVAALALAALALPGGAQAADRQSVLRQIDHYRDVAWRWQERMGKQRTPTSYTARRSADPAYRQWVLELWKERATKARRQAKKLVRRNALGLLDRIDRFRNETWRWQDLMGVRRTPTSYSARRLESVAYRRWVLDLWKSRAAKARRQGKNPPHEAQWRCIQRHEGAWRANTGNGFYGGLQMNMAFQRRYAPKLLRRKGTADNWTPLEQMWVAERAHEKRGFHPWPNTARYCGLL